VGMHGAVVEMLVAYTCLEVGIALILLVFPIYA